MPNRNSEVYFLGFFTYSALFDSCNLYASLFERESNIKLETKLIIAKIKKINF